MQPQLNKSIIPPVPLCCHNTMKSGLRSRSKILPTPYSGLEMFTDSRLLKIFFPDSDSPLLKIFFPDSDSSKIFFLTPTQTPDSSKYARAPDSRLLKTCLSYNKIIVIFKGSESAVSFKEALVSFFQIF